MKRLTIIVYNILRSFSGLGYNFLISLAAITILGKSFWGSYVQLLLSIYLISFISNFGNKEYLLKEFSRKPNKINQNFLNIFIIRLPLLLSGSILFFLFPYEIAIYALFLTLLIFIYRSFDSLIFYYQLFRQQLLAETIGFVIIIGTIFIAKNVSLSQFLLAYCVSIALKIILMVPYIKISWQLTCLRLNIRDLRDCIPYFLIGLSGWLSSRIDLYFVSIFLTESRLAEYQVLINSFIMIESMAGLIINPFTKHIHRISKSALSKIKRNVWLFGLCIMGPFSFFLWVILEVFIQLGFSPINYILAGMTSLPIFAIIVDIIQYYRENKERKVMYINFLSIFLKALGFISLLIYFDKIIVIHILCILFFVNLFTLILYKSKLPISRLN